MPFLRRTALFGLAALGYGAGACALIADLGDRQLEDRSDGGRNRDARAGEGGGPGPGGGSCTTALTLTTPEMLLLLDASGSMANTGGVRLTAQQGGVKAFIEKAETKTISAGAAFHPATATASCTDTTGYTTPKVGLQAVEGAGGQAIIDAVTNTPANGVSAWQPALAGVKTPLEAYVGEGKKPVLVFVADLSPSTIAPCGGEPGGTEKLEAALRDLQGLATPIRTYVIGMPDPGTDADAHIELFNRLARAGATGHETAETSKSPTAEWLADALGKIRDELACEFDLPEDGASLAVDDTAFASVDGAGACSGDGYYAINVGSAASGRARLCPESCAKVKGGSSFAACKD